MKSLDAWITSTPIASRHQPYFCGMSVVARLPNFRYLSFVENRGGWKVGVIDRREGDPAPNIATPSIVITPRPGTRSRSVRSAFAGAS